MRPRPAEQSLVDKAVSAMGGAERLAGVQTVTYKGTSSEWEPEQSDVPGGEARFANETTFEGFIDAASRSIAHRLCAQLRLSGAAHLHLSARS